MRPTSPSRHTSFLPKSTAKSRSAGTHLRCLIPPTIFRLLRPVLFVLIFGFVGVGANAAPATPTSPSPGSTTSPGPTTASSSVTLRWSGSSGATSYGLGVRDLATNALVVDTNVSGTSYTANLSAGKQYRWNVNACNSTGCSSYTTPLYFQTPAAIPATPTNPSPGSTSSPGPTTASSNVTLSWSGSSGATYYGVGVRDLATNVLVVDTNASGTSYTANLSAGKQYRWNVNACNTAGCSSYTTPLYFQTPTAVTAPGAPQNLAASGGNTVVGLAWNAPSTNGGAAITSYRVFRGTTSSNRQIVTSGGCANLGAVLGCTDTNVTNGQSYNYIVSAVNSAGQGAPSNSAIATPVAPATPTATTQAASNITTTSFVMNGTINPNGVSTQFYFEWGTSSTLNSFSTTGSANLGSGTNAVNVNSTPLIVGACNATYFYRVVAAPTGGNIVRGSIVAVTTATCSTPPPTPTNPSPGSTSSPGPTLSSNTATLSWNASSGATYYGLGVRDLATNVLVVDTNVNGTSYTANLSAGKQYRWNVNACNSAGCSSYTTPLYFQTPSAPPGSFTLSNNAPVCDTVSPVGPAVRLNWTQSGGATSYDLYRNGSLSSAGITGTTFYNNLNLTAGQTYTYFVRARNSSGTTDSNQISVSIPSNICPTSSGSFTVSAAPSARTINQGESTTFALSINSQNGFNGPVSVYALNLPLGYVAQGTAWSASTVTPPANGTASSTLTVLSSGGTQTGTFTVTLRAIGGGVTRDAQVSLTVNPVNNAAFSVSATPTYRTVLQGGATNFTLTVQSLNGFNSPVSVSALNLPPGYALQGTGWTQETVTPPANGTVNTTLSVTTSGATQTGTFPVTLRGISGALRSEVNVNLTITGNTSRPVASFAYSPGSPAAGQTVQFTDTSSGSSLSWAWDFDGNGTVDSTVKSPTYQFGSAGTHRVILSVNSPYGSDTYAQDVQVSQAAGTTAPSITRVTRQYPGVFLQGGFIDLRFDVTVDWKGSVGLVRFTVNNGSPIDIPGTSTGAARTFVINRDLLPGSNLITITPINGAGVVGTSNPQTVHVYRLPSWLQDAVALDSSALKVIASATNLEYGVSFEFPRPRIYGIITIPDGVVPFFGGRFGLAETFVRINGKVSPGSGSGSLSATGVAGFEAAGGSVNASLGASGAFQLTPPNGLLLTNGAVNFKLSGTIKKEEGLLAAIPTLRPLLVVPQIRNFVDSHAKLGMEISPSLDTTFSFGQDTTTSRLAFSGGTATLGLDMKAYLRASAGPLTAETWVSGGGRSTVGVPGTFLRRVELNGQAGAKFTFNKLIKVEQEATCNFGIAWTPERGVAPYFCGSGGSPAANTFPVLKHQGDIRLSLIKPEFSRFGPYSVFRPDRSVKSSEGVVPAAVQDTAFVSNVFTGASPTIAEAGGGKLLMWAHQNSALPVLQSTDISWSYNDGNAWTVPSVFRSDTQVELSPVAGADAAGNVAAAWLRIKDLAFSTPVNSTADLPLFYKRLEVVGATFTTASRTWGAVTALTDDASLDSDLRLSSDGTSRLMLTWLSNPGGDFVSTTGSPSALKYSFWNGTAWNTPAVLASSLAGVSGHAAATQSSQAFVVVPRDPDPAVDDDSLLDLYTWNGSAWSGPSAFAAGGGGNRLPAAVYDFLGIGHVVWQRGNDIVHATLNDPTPVVIRAGSDAVNLSDAKLLINPQGNLTLLWQQTVDNGPANLFSMIYDPATRSWSADRRLNANASLAHDVRGYYGRDNQMHGVYLSTEVSRTSTTIDVEGETRLISNIPETGRTDIRLLDYPLVVDIAVADADLAITPQAPRAGDEVTATLTVRNAGDFPVSNFLAYLYVGTAPTSGVLVGTASVLDLLRAGDARTLAFSFTMPAGGGNVFAVVDPTSNVVELTKANNRATVYADNTAPQASISANVLSGRIPLSVSFDASSSFDTEGDAISFSWAFADGGQSASGAQVTHTFSQPGTYPVTVAVTDARGAVGTAVVLITVAPGAATVQFASAAATTGENSGRATISVTRGGDISVPVTVDVRTVDNAAAVPCADTATMPGVAFARCDYATTIETLAFAPGETTKSFSVPLVDDAHVEPSETVQIALSNPTGGATFGPASTMTLTITSDDAQGQPNPASQGDAAGISFFVRQHYLDFLNREPEAGEPWSRVIGGCADQFNTNQAAPSAACDRVQVSYSIFGSPEFQIKGDFVFRLHRLSFVNPADAPRERYLPSYDQMITDMRSVTGTTPAEVYAKKATFANLWVLRPEFLAVFPNSMGHTQFVDTLLSRYALQSIRTMDPANPDIGQKITLTRDALMSELTGGTLTRAQVVRAIADSDEVSAAERDPSFVAIQYYGYLRRKPETTGYGNWLNYLSTHPGDYRTMVNGFLNSQEYKLRFGQP